MDAYSCCLRSFRFPWWIRLFPWIRRRRRSICERRGGRIQTNACSNWSHLCVGLRQIIHLGPKGKNRVAKKTESFCSRPSLIQLSVIGLVDREFPLHNVGVPWESAKESHRASRHAGCGKRDARSFTTANQPCRRQDSRIVRL